MSELLKNGIQTRIIYPYPIHKMKAYKTYFKNQKFTICEKKTKGIFCLPMYPELEINKLNSFAKN